MKIEILFSGNIVCTFLLISITLAYQTTFAQSPLSMKERVLAFSIEIDSPLDSVWSRWTTSNGRKKFLAPTSKMELSTLGHLEVLFNPSAPEGQRGAENNRVLAFQDKQMLSFTWDAPPQWPELRKQRTVVTLRFYKLTDAKTLLVFHQTGWGTGNDWDAVYNYFVKAWGEFVLPNLKYSLEVSALDWTDFPNRLPKGLKAATLLTHN